MLDDLKSSFSRNQIHCPYKPTQFYKRVIRKTINQTNQNSIELYNQSVKMSKYEEPAVGIPYNPAYQAPMPQQVPYNQAAYQVPPMAQQYYVGENPYQAGMVPPNAIYGDPKGVPIQQTIYRDTPAPFNCLHCGDTGLTTIKSKPSPAAFVGCMMPFMLGVCFLCPSMDCLWHKYHYCPSCNQKVADFEKSDICLVVDPPNWEEKSFALPA